MNNGLQITSKNSTKMKDKSKITGKIQEAKIKELENTSNSPDPITKQMMDNIKAKKLSLENEALQQRINHLEDEHELRKKYAFRIFYFVACYLIIAAAYLPLENALHIHDDVLISFLGATVVNTIALLAVVLKYLFKGKN